MHALLCAEAALGTKQKNLIYCLCTYFEWFCVDRRCIIVLQSWCFISVLGNKYFGTCFENMLVYSHTVCCGGCLDGSVWVLCCSSSALHTVSICFTVTAPGSA